MQILKTPPTHTDMQASLTMTGITLLKQGRYTCRHGGMKTFEQNGLSNINKKIRTVVKKRKSIPKPNDVTLKQKIRYYNINKREVIHRIKGFVNQMPGEKLLYFWTVSFPLHTPDTECMSLLNRWLTRLRQEKMLKSYLWVSERQENGTLHFHIVINNRMCVKKANKYMRACIMHSINEGVISWSREAAMKYNGVDIAKNRKTRKTTNFAKKKSQRSLEAYLTKYVTKNVTEFTQLAWHCSRDYSNLIISIRFTLPELKKSNTRTFIETKPLYETEWYSFYKWKTDTPETLLKYLASINQYVLAKLN